jgi:hypothetical protein
MLLARLAVYSILGWLLDRLGHGWQTTEFWCVVALYWAAEQIARVETQQQLLKELEQRRKLETANNENTDQNTGPRS